jgi:RimJ/RimL family protein N-acetyltransferase
MKIELLQFEREDIPRMISWIPSEESLILWSGPYFHFPLDVQQLEDYLQSGVGSPPPRRIYKVKDANFQNVIGHIELNQIDRRNMAATISKVLVGNPENRGKGYGQAMVRALLRIAFVEEKLHRVDLKVFDFNRSAIECYKRLGFQTEGHLRDYRKVGNAYWSSFQMSILENEWKP